MSILATIQRLIQGSPDAQAATSRMIEILAAEAIKSGQPDALVAVAAQWENLLEGSTNALMPAATPSFDDPINFTTAEELKPVVIEIMQQCYLGGVVEVTNGTIKKAINTRVLSKGGWKDGDLQDSDPKPGVQPLWHKTLSQALYELRQTGDVSNDPRAWRTYRLAPQHLPLLPATQEPKQLTSWEEIA
jgi:hypothetical protein